MAASEGAADRRTRRIGRAFAAVAALALLLGAAAAGVRGLFDEARLRAELGRRLDRRVSYEGVSPGLFRISVRGLEVGDTAGFAADPLLRLERLDLHISWRDLLRGHLRFPVVTLSGGVAGLEFDTAWRSNLEGLLAPRGAAGYLDVERIHLQDVRFVVRSPAGGFEAGPVSGTITGLDAPPFAYALEAEALGGRVEVSGRFDPAGAPVPFRLAASNLDVGPILEAVPSAAAAFDAKGLRLAASAEGEASRDGVRARLSVDLGEGIRADGDLTLSAFAGAASLADVRADGALRMRVRAEAFRRVPLLRAALEPLDPQGPVEASLRLDGPLGRLPASVEGRLLGLSVKPPRFAGRVEGMEGVFRADPRTVRLENVTATIEGGRARIGGTYDARTGRLSLDMSAEDVSLERLPERFGFPSIRAGGVASFHGRIGGTLDSPDLRGEATAHEATLFGVPLQEARTDLTFDGRRLRADGVRAGACGGTIRGAATVEPADDRMPFAVTASADGAALPEVLRALLGFSGAAAGTLDGTLTLRGEGTAVEGYAGRGAVSYRSVGLRSFPMLETLAPFLGLPSVEATTRFDAGEAVFKVGGGKVLFEGPMRLENRFVALRAEGAIGLDGALDLSCEAAFPSSAVPSAVGGSPFAALSGLRREGGRTVVPFRAGGTVEAPRYGLDLRPAG